MHVLVELYTPKQAWLSLSPGERERFVAAVRSALQALADAGVNCLALGRTDGTVDHATAHAYFGVWSAPDREALQILLQGIRASGWYEHFHHVNGAGRDDGVTGHLADLAAA